MSRISESKQCEPEDELHPSPTRQKRKASSISKENNAQQPHFHPLGTIIQKEFDSGVFEGNVDGHEFNADGTILWYHVIYTDGDQEHMTAKEIEPLLLLNKALEDRRKKRKTHISSEDEDEEFNGERTKIKKSNSKKTPPPQSNTLLNHFSRSPKPEQGPSRQPSPTRKASLFGSSLHQTSLSSFITSGRKQLPSTKARIPSPEESDEDVKEVKAEFTTLDDDVQENRNHDRLTPRCNIKVDDSVDDQKRAVDNGTRKRPTPRSARSGKPRKVPAYVDSDIDDASKDPGEQDDDDFAAVSSEEDAEDMDMDFSALAEEEEELDEDSEDENAAAKKKAGLPKPPAAPVASDGDKYGNELPKKKKPPQRKAPSRSAPKPRRSSTVATRPNNRSNEVHKLLKTPYTAGDGLPVIKDPQEMFDDMIENLMAQKRSDGFSILSLVNQFSKNRPLKVATMCSGTESPILALDMIQNAIRNYLKSHPELVDGDDDDDAISVPMEHIFSCEIEPFKQGYIERNFSPPLLFRDIRELKNEKAQTAYGSLMEVPREPGCVHMLIAGTSCVDYSNLNNKKKTLDEAGESGQTFMGMMGWILKAEPPIVIIENVSGAPWDAKIELFDDAGYSATFLRMDTKDYYIPHTRMRGYLFAVRKNTGSDARPAIWKELVKSLRRPASASLDAFMLPNDDPRVLRGRARLTAESMAGDNGDRAGRTDWTKCETRHQRARTTEELGESRPLTEWSDATATKMPGFG